MKIVRLILAAVSINGLKEPFIILFSKSRYLIKHLEIANRSYRAPAWRYLLSSLFQCWGYFRPKHKSSKTLENQLKSIMLIGINCIALAEYSQMSTNVPGFQSFFRFLASFRNDQIGHQQHKGWLMNFFQKMPPFFSLCLPAVN